MVLGIIASWAVTRIVLARGEFRGRRAAQGYARLAWQMGVVLGLEQAYELARGQIPESTDAGVAWIHAYRLLDLEWQHGLFIEERVERFFLHFHLLMNAVDIFYVVCHVVVTIGALLWLYWRHRRQYMLARNLLMIATAIALVVFYLYPVAPPRLLWNYGFVDPMELHRLVPAGGAEAGSYTYNPYAAMPSLHVAYAIAVSWGLFAAYRQRIFRAVILLYPVVMAAVVVITGNHWVLDVLGAVITVFAARMIIFGATSLRSVFPAPQPRMSV